MSKFSEFTYLPFWWIRAVLGRHKPLQSVIFISDRCNLSCKHCSVYNHELPNDKTFAQIEEELRYCYSLGSRFVDFEGGEPTLWRDGDRLAPFQGHVLGNVHRERSLTNPGPGSQDDQFIFVQARRHLIQSLEARPKPGNGIVVLGVLGDLTDRLFNQFLDVMEAIAAPLAGDVHDLAFGVARVGLY